MERACRNSYCGLVVVVVALLLLLLLIASAHDLAAGISSCLSWINVEVSG